MSGRVIHQVKPRHECTDLPEPPETWTAWRCDECGDIWTWIPSASLDPNAQGSWLRGLPNPSREWKPYRPGRWRIRILAVAVVIAFWGTIAWLAWRHL